MDMPEDPQASQLSFPPTSQEPEQAESEEQTIQSASSTRQPPKYGAWYFVWQVFLHPSQYASLVLKRRETYRTYWQWQNPSWTWRTAPEINGIRKGILNIRRAIKPDIKKGRFPFRSIRLNRAAIEWLLATYEDVDGQETIDTLDQQQPERRLLDLRGAILYGDLSGLPLQRARMGLTEEEWFTASPHQCKRAGAKFRKANLSGADLEEASLSGAHLEKANLNGTHLRGADLFNAHLKKANLSGADLEGANLSGAHLEGANLNGAHLEKANLFKAHLNGASLYKADLKDANFHEASLEGAKLRKADLEGAKGADELLEVLDDGRSTIARTSKIRDEFSFSEWLSTRLTVPQLDALDRIQAWLKRILQFTASPFVLLAIGTVLTGILIPIYTTYLQDHQKALDVKATIISNMSQTIANSLAELQLIQTDQESQDLNTALDHFHAAFRDLRANGGEIEAELSAYFSQDQYCSSDDVQRNSNNVGYYSIPFVWHNYYHDLIDDLYSLTSEYNPQDRANVVNDLQQTFSIYRVDQDAYGQSYQEPNWAKLNTAQPDHRYIEMINNKPVPTTKLVKIDSGTWNLLITDIEDFKYPVEQCILHSNMHFSG